MLRIFGIKLEEQKGLHKNGYEKMYFWHLVEYGNNLLAVFILSKGKPSDEDGFKMSQDIMNVICLALKRYGVKIIYGDPPDMKNKMYSCIYCAFKFKTNSDRKLFCLDCATL